MNLVIYEDMLYARRVLIWIRKASTGSVPRAVASGVGANRRSLPLAVLTRRLNQYRER